MASGRPFRMSKGIVDRIHAAIDKLFDRAKVRVLGPWSVDKRMVITGAEPDKTLPGLFATAAAQHGSLEPDKSILRAMLSIPESYIEAQREATKARVVQSVSSFLTEAHAKGIDTDVPTVLGGQLAEVWGKVTDDMHRVIDTEAQNVRNGGALDAIMRVNADAQIEDPVVYFVVVRDEHLCKECKKLHLLDDETTPRLWYLSEISHGYHRKGDDFPSLGGEHPHCRCTLVTLMPGYGFDAKGMVHYVKPGHSAIDEQRKLGKAETKAIDAYPNENWYVPRDSQDAVPIGGFILKITKHPGVDFKGRQLYKIHTHDGRKLLTHETPALLKERAKNLEPRWEMRGDRIAVLGPPRILYKTEESVGATRQDLLDAIDHTEIDRGPDELQFHGVKMMDPKDFAGVDAEWFDEDSPGWLNKHPKDRWPELLKQRYLNRDFSHIVEYHNRGQMPMAVQIDGQLGDGLGRSMFHHAIGQQIPVAVYSTKQSGVKKAEPLQKPELDRRDVVQHFKEKLGFTEHEQGGNHDLYFHPEAKHIKLIIQRGSHGATLNNYMIGQVMKQTGTRYNAAEGFVPDPNHPHAAEYRRRGLLKDAPTLKTWKPPAEHQSVEIGKLASTGQPQPWLVDKYAAQLQSDQAHRVPPIRAERDGEDYFITTGDEQYEAAKRAGMTHVPVQLTNIEKTELLVKSTREGQKLYDKLKERYEKNNVKYRFNGKVEPDEIPELYHKPVTMNFPGRAVEGWEGFGDPNSEERRFKTVFDIDRSMGAGEWADEDEIEFYRRQRRHFEEDGLGIPRNTPDDQRPVYGALAHEPHHEYFGGADGYGPFFVTLKPHKHQHTTFTPDDSFGIDADRVFTNDARHHVVDRFRQNAYAPYVEAQIHGGVYFPHDVESIHMSPQVIEGSEHEDYMDPIVEFAKQHKIPVYRHEYRGRGPLPFSKAERREAARGAQFSTKLIYDPRTPEEAKEHSKLRSRIISDLDKYGGELGDKANDLLNAGDESGDAIFHAVHHVWPAIKALKRNEHTVTGHELAVKEIRKHNPAAFPYLDLEGKPLPEKQETFRLEPQAAPPAAAAPKAKRRASKAKADTRTLPLLPAGSTSPSARSPEE